MARHVAQVSVLSTLLLTGCGVTGITQSKNSTLANCNPFTVEIDGRGKTKVEAVAAARRNAVTQELGELISYEGTLVNDELNETTGFATRGEVVETKILSERVGPDGGYIVDAEVTMCKRNVIVPDRKIAINSAENQNTQHTLNKRLDELDADDLSEAQRKQGFANFLDSFLSPLGMVSVHEYEVLSWEHDAEANTKVEKSRPVDVTVLAKISVSEQVRKSFDQLIASRSLKKRSPGLLGSGYESIIQKNGFAYFDQRLEQSNNPYDAASDLMYQSSGNAPSFASSISSFKVLASHYELIDWQAELISEKIEEAIRDFVQHPPVVVAWSSDDERLFTVPVSANDLNIGTAYPFDQLTIQPENAKGQPGRANAVKIKLRDIHQKGIDSSWYQRLLSPLSSAWPGESKNKISSIRRGDTRIEIRLTVGDNAARKVNRFTLERQ